MFHKIDLGKGYVFHSNDPTFKDACACVRRSAINTPIPDDEVAMIALNRQAQALHDCGVEGCA